MREFKFGLLIAMCILTPNLTIAQGVTAVTLGTNASMAVLPAQNRSHLSVCNQSATANIAISFGSITPAKNTAGSYTIPPLNCLTWSAGDFPDQGQVNGISDTASTPTTWDQR